MARTPGLDGLLARNRKAAEVLNSPTADEATTPPDVAAPPGSADHSDSGRPGQPMATVASDIELIAGQPASRLAARVQPTLPTPSAAAPPHAREVAPARRPEALSAAADRKQLNTYVRKAVIRDARRRAEDDGTTISDVVDRLLEGWLSGQFRLL